MNPTLMLSRIVHIIQSRRINVSTEIAAHNAIHVALIANGMDVQREVWLSDADRIDLLVGTIGIEVKVAGSRRDIWRQLSRYAANPAIEGLVLATATAWPVIKQINGTQLRIASLTRGWL